MATVDWYKGLPTVIQQWVDTYNNNELEAHMALYPNDASITVPLPADGTIDINPDGTKSVWRKMEEALDSAAPGRKAVITWAAVDEINGRVSVAYELRLDPSDRKTVFPMVILYDLSEDRTKIVKDQTFLDGSFQKILSG